MNIKKILVGSASAALLLSRIAMPAFAAPVQTNGSFEQTDVVGNFNTVNIGGLTITDWSVDSGSVDHIDDYWQHADGDQSIDLNGLTTGTISQTIPTIVGATYNVSFALSGNPDSSVDVQLASPSNKTLNVSATNGGAVSPYSFDTLAEGNTLGSMGWKTKQYSFVATSTSSVLTFASTTAGAFGPAIDNVVIDEVLNTFPVPAQCDQNIVYNLIEGTNGSNILNGTSGNDLILAKGGSDVVDGKGGNDCIDGGAGSNSLKGGAGNDVILGGDGSDSIQGNDGMDNLYGNGGSDAISGGNDADQIWGGAGSDALRGDAGDDSLHGEAGSDAANGGAGTGDTCTAEAKTQCEL